MTIIDFQNVTKTFRRTAALDNISFQVPPGTVFALLGENGAGKTTAIRIMLGLCKPDQGTSTVLGLNSRKDDLKIRQTLGYVPEQPVLYDWMTAEQTGHFAAAFYPDGFQRRYQTFLTEHDVPAAAKIRTLSKGQRAKVSLALALAHDPELLILDEPTSGLDALVRRQFLESMIDRAASGKTVFLSSHQIGEVERVADTVAILKKSKLLLVEPLESLKKRTHLITVTLNNDEPLANVPLETVIETQKSGRELRFVGHGLAGGSETFFQSHPNIARYEIRTPSLEEIFLGYMR
ncbi:MAG: ABC transporter ATP-binding protein [Planctomycetaceae bacterium]|jgi:ABC-2 type transport system ATP-binding protein|nr:ABC transporter ATP-binding protein [Planctomycetaceae bacterium]